VISRKVELDLSQQDGKYFKPSFYIVFTVYHCCRSLYLTNYLDLKMVRATETCSPF